MAQAVLGDDDRAIDDQAEVERAEAHQVGADPALPHADGGHQHGKRNDQRGDHRGAEIAEQQEQHRDDQQRAFGEVVRHGGDGGVDELGAVEHRLDLRCPAAAIVAICCIRASTAAATVRLFAPISIRAVPTTTSRPFSLALPVRVSPPIETAAMSLMRTGTPPRV